MSNTSIDFLYLSEPDMIAAGVRDMDRCVDVLEELLILVRRGDFRMAGPIAMAHGAGIDFPENPEFPGMPADGPDRRFMAMPAYLGGRFGTVGMKWYGSNIENREKGLPRSIHTFVLNDADTGAPLALMSANLISAYRTGAKPGVAVKHLARKDSKVLGIVGPGVIGRAVAEATLGQRPSIDRLVVMGVDGPDVQRFADAIRPAFPQIKKIDRAESVEEVAREADILTLTTSGPGGAPYVNKNWIKPGALLVLPAGVRFDEEFLVSGEARSIVDSWRLYDGWFAEYGEAAYTKLAKPGMYWHQLVNAGKIPKEHLEEIADIATGVIPGRQNEDEIFLFSAGGMPVEDVAWATDVYRNALKKGIGQSLNLWESPNLA